MLEWDASSLVERIGIPSVRTIQKSCIVLEHPVFISASCSCIRRLPSICICHFGFYYGTSMRSNRACEKSRHARFVSTNMTVSHVRWWGKDCLCLSWVEGDVSFTSHRIALLPVLLQSLSFPLHLYSFYSSEVPVWIFWVLSTCGYSTRAFAKDGWWLIVEPVYPIFILLLPNIPVHGPQWFLIVFRALFTHCQFLWFVSHLSSFVLPFCFPWFCFLSCLFIAMLEKAVALSLRGNEKWHSNRCIGQCKRLLLAGKGWRGGGGRGMGRDLFVSIGYQNSCPFIERTRFQSFKFSCLISFLLTFFYQLSFTYFH